MRDDELPPVDEEQTVKRRGCSSGISSCGCPTCSLYKWYPPLLIVSTLLAGVFCALYLTKPVHVISSMERGEGRESISLPVREKAPQDEGARADLEDLVAIPEGTLDPFLGSLPGEQFSQAETGGVFLNPFENSGGGTKLRPLVVDRPHKGLFVPMKAIAPVDAAPTEDPAVESADLLVSKGAEDGEDGRLTVDVPVGEQSELVFTFEGDGDQKGILDLSEASRPLPPAEHLVDLIGSKTGLSSLADLQNPAASIIEEFYVSEDNQGRLQEEGEQGVFH